MSGARALQSRRDDPLRSFAWGRPGWSARELAWSILYDATGSPTLAGDWCVDFTTEVIIDLPNQAFTLSVRDVFDWLDADRGSGHLRCPEGVNRALHTHAAR